MLTVTVPLAEVRVVAELEGVTDPIVDTVLEAVKEALWEAKREGVERAVAVVCAVPEVDTLEDTETEPEKEGDTDTDGVAELRVEKEGEMLDEKQPVEDADTVYVPDSLDTTLLVPMGVGDTEPLAEWVELALKVCDGEFVADRVSVWQGLPEGVETGVCVVLCESERDPV